MENISGRADTGIFVVCSDKAIMDNINTMLKRKGMIGITDATGKTNYMIDARSGAGRATKKLEEFLMTDDPGDDTDLKIKVLSDREITERITCVLMGYGFDMSLIGTRLILIIVKRMVRDRSNLYLGTKQLYSMAGELLDLSYDQSERDIRYAVRKSRFAELKLKSALIFRVLTEDSVKLICEQIKEDPDQRSS